jgi:hypothetical protein
MSALPSGCCHGRTELLLLLLLSPAAGVLLLMHLLWQASRSGHSLQTSPRGIECESAHKFYSSHAHHAPESHEGVGRDVLCCVMRQNWHLQKQMLSNDCDRTIVIQKVPPFGD